MSYPENPKSILVRNRIVAVLRDIAAGDDFFYTPGIVYDNFKSWKEREAFPAYMVFFGAGGEWQEYQGLQAAETFTVIVHGDFKDDDAPTAVRRGIRDVRKAIMDDMTQLSTVESDGDDDEDDWALGRLCDRLTLGPTETDNGAGAQVGVGWFNQEFKVTISGYIENL